MGAYNVVSRASMAAGQPEDISAVLANLDAIAAVLNGGLDNSNVNAAAAIALSKLAGYPTDATKFARGDGAWAVPVGGRTKIAEVVLAATTATIDLTAIPGTYSNLYLEGLLRGSNASLAVEGLVTFNADSALHYTYSANFFNSTTTVGQNASLGDTKIALSATTIPAASGVNSAFSPFCMTIPGYADISTSIPGRQLLWQIAGYASNPLVLGQIWNLIGNGIWSQTPAITRITFTPSVGSWAAGSRVTLYGDS